MVTPTFQSPVAPLPTHSTAHDLPKLDVASVDFTQGIQVLNRTKRFVASVPVLVGGGELLVYPEGSPRAGEAIKETPEHAPDRGVVFYNGKDSVWQGARGNGKETILINDVTPEQAALLLQKRRELEEQKSPLDIDGVKALIKYARDTLGIVDFYDKKMDGVLKDMKLIAPENPYYMEVTKPTVHSAVFIRSGFTFDGPVPQTFPQGAVLLSDGQFAWGIDKDVFQRNFVSVSADGERPLRSLDEEFPS